MTATIVTQHMIANDNDEMTSRAAGWTDTRSPSTLTGKLYQFHGFRVLDADGQSVGIVDWIWSDHAGAPGEFLGVHLRWLRGTARAVPAEGAQLDRRNATIRVAYRKDQIRRAPRFAIDRALNAEQKRSIRSHYRPSPAFVPGPATVEGLVA
jgi:hypothetical protein